MHTLPHTFYTEFTVTLAHQVRIIIITFSLLRHNIHFIYYKCGFVHYNLHCNMLKNIQNQKTKHYKLLPNIYNIVFFIVVFFNPH